MDEVNFFLMYVFALIFVGNGGDGDMVKEIEGAFEKIAYVAF
jgi:hypothetical protein